MGVRLWNALNSDNWRAREAATKAYLQFITQESGLPPKYKEDNTKHIFATTCELAMIALNDKLQQIMLEGLKILFEALTPKICGGDISPKVVDRTIKPFIYLLLDKVCELTYRGRELTLGYFYALFRHPAVDIKHAIDAIMAVTKSGKGPIEKAPWRQIAARLDVLNGLIGEFGIDEDVWQWWTVYNKLVAPSYGHSNPDVRLLAMESTMMMYRKVGPVIIDVINKGPSIKPTVKSHLIKRMDDEAPSLGFPTSKKPKSAARGKSRSGSRSPERGFVGKSLEQVKEEDEQREATPA